MTCAFSVGQAACVYSLIRPPRTGLRWIRAVSRSVTVARGGSRSAPGPDQLGPLGLAQRGIRVLPGLRGISCHSHPLRLVPLGGPPGGDLHAPPIEHSCRSTRSPPPTWPKCNQRFRARHRHPRGRRVSPRSGGYVRPYGLVARLTRLCETASRAGLSASGYGRTLPASVSITCATSPAALRWALWSRRARITFSL